MQIKILGEHFTVTQAIEEYISEKFSHLSPPEKVSHVEFRVGKERENQYIKFHTQAPNHETIFLNSSDVNLYAAIDKLMIKIHRSFVKNKECYNTHLHKAA